MPPFGSLVRRFFRLLWIFAPALATGPWALARPAARDRWYDRLVGCLERAGATFIKLGQIASSRPDLVPPALCEHLARLHDRAPAHDAATSERMVREAFGKPIAEIFAAFEPGPIASGSIAQVHRARLADGRPVAVKIRHPEAEAVIETDLVIIRFFASLADRIPTAHWLSLPESARNFSDAVHGQLDLTEEARNLDRFRANFAASPAVHFPEPLHPWVHPTVLVESFEEGEPIARYLAGRHPANASIARHGLQGLFQMIFVDGLVHADLHPGNILIRLEEGEPHLVLLDVGMVAELDARDQANYMAFFHAVASGDGKRGAELMIIHAPHHACEDPARFTAEIDAIFDEVRDRPVAEIEIAVVLSKIMARVRKHRIKLESAFTTVNVSLMVLEGLGRQLDPSLNLIEEVGPLLAMAMASGASDGDPGVSPARSA